MQKQPLDSRDAITLLVHSFYTRVKADALLGPIFNNVENFSWEVHIPIMIDFWETVLLDAAKYRGQTMRKHIELHRRSPLLPEHFERWKQLFYETLDSQFEGPQVEEAHRKVEAMSGLMQYKIAESDKKGFLM